MPFSTASSAGSSPLPTRWRASPHEELLALVETGPKKPDGDREEFETAILETRAQAPYEPGFASG